MTNTIVAVATPMGVGGIGIVRISGPQAFDIGEKIYKGKKAFASLKANYLSYGWVHDDNDIIDEVMIVKMVKPRSFTREDVVEIHCHGGRVSISRILEVVLSLGARLAEPGEFTKRAFLNGRIDLSQAEAVIDLINAKTYESSKTAVRQLEGRLSEKVKEAMNELVKLMAHLEAMVDYPEYDIEELTEGIMLDGINKVEHTIKSLLEGYSKGRILREGMTVVITGKPNVGKSSLLNRLAGRQRAIVTELPGTTRDIIEEYIDIKGVPVRFVDTAGIRETANQVEQIGVEMAKKEIQEAELVLFIVDAGTGLEKEDEEILEELEEKKKLVIINKVDLNSGVEISGAIEMSIKEDKGIEQLYNAIAEKVIPEGNDVLVTNARHKHNLDQCLKSLDNAKVAIEEGIPVDCVSIDLRNAADALGAITGESVNESVVQEIFSRFCIGK